MCAAFIRSRIKEHVTSVKEKYLYLRHVLQIIGALIIGAKCQYVYLAVGQAEGLLRQVTH